MGAYRHGRGRRGSQHEVRASIPVIEIYSLILITDIGTVVLNQLEIFCWSLNLELCTNHSVFYL